MSSIDKALRELRAEYRQAEAPASLRRRVAGAFKPARREWGLAWMAVPAAVALVIALGTTHVPAVEPLELRAWAPTAPQVGLTPKPAIRIARRPKAAAKEAEIVSDFFPLRAGPVLAPGEVGQVVRTKLARWEARRFGLTWGDGPDVPADVLVGWDGSARAVRLVHTAFND